MIHTNSILIIIKKIKIIIINSKMKIYFQFLPCKSVNGISMSIILNIDAQKYVFNIPETFQRY